MKTKLFLILGAVLLATMMVTLQSAKAESCHWVSGAAGTMYTDYDDENRWGPDHRVLWIWNGDSNVPPRVDFIRYYDGGWQTVPNDPNHVSYNEQRQSHTGWWGYLIDTTETFWGGDYSNWNDDSRWDGYICN